MGSLLTVTGLLAFFVGLKGLISGKIKFLKIVGRPKAAILTFVGFVVMVAFVPDTPDGPPLSSSSRQELAPTTSASSSKIVSDRFQLDWELDGTDLLLAVDTDLPDEAELAVTVNRIYFEVGVDDAYARDYFSVSSEPVAQWRQPRRISLGADAWKASLSRFQEEMAASGPVFAFEVDRIEDEVDIRVVLHSNQDDPRFGGRGNPNLVGSATSRSGNTTYVRAEASFLFPLDGPQPARTATRVAYDGLIKGEAYRLSEETPLMPALEREGDPTFLAGVIYLPAGSVIYITGVLDQHPSGVGSAPWYEVTLVGDESTAGWINSVALMPQTITRR